MIDMSPARDSLRVLSLPSLSHQRELLLDPNVGTAISSWVPTQTRKKKNVHKEREKKSIGFCGVGIYVTMKKK